jgi:hypothetical protein
MRHRPRILPRRSRAAIPPLSRGHHLCCRCWFRPKPQAVGLCDDERLGELDPEPDTIMVLAQEADSTMDACNILDGHPPPTIGLVDILNVGRGTDTMAGANCPRPRLCDQGVTGGGPHPSLRARFVMRGAQNSPVTGRYLWFFNMVFCWLAMAPPHWLTP